MDGRPPGLRISCEADIQAELDRRRPGTSRHVTQRREPDTVEILSGVFEGRTTGDAHRPIRNQDQRSRITATLPKLSGPAMPTTPIPRNTASATTAAVAAHRKRETAVRVAAGAIARKWLRERYGVEIRGWMSALGPIDIPSSAKPTSTAMPSSPPTRPSCRIGSHMDGLRRDLDSVGARITVVAREVPPGWGAGL